MKREKELKNYILRNFILIILLIGVMEIISDLFYVKIIGPLFSKILVVNLSSVSGVAEGLSFSFEVLGAMIFSKDTVISIGDLIEKLTHINLVNPSYLDELDRVTSLSEAWGIGYAVILMVSCIIMLFFMILPYIIACVIFTKKISHKVKCLEEERIKKEKEEERAKNLLLSDITHDIKTPITTIAGFSQALYDGEVDEDKKKEYLEAIKNKSMQTADMVTLLFEYVRLDSDGYTLKKSREDVYEIIRMSVASYFTDFEEHDIELDIDIPEKEMFMDVDKIQLERAINNILINSYKHNPPKSKVLVEVTELDKWISVKISDNGNLIESDTAKHIFEPFVQEDKARSGKRGTGLGLSITRKIVELHGGRIRLIQYKQKEPVTKTFEIQLKK